MSTEAPKITCSKCSGTKTIRDYYYNDCRGCKGHGCLPSGQECTWCGGSGLGDKKIYYSRECPRCHGLGYLIQKQADHTKQPDPPASIPQERKEFTRKEPERSLPQEGKMPISLKEFILKSDMEFKKWIRDSDMEFKKWSRTK